ncbi:unnamed protein product [Echinostoma caproni]|uniref:Coiled-coil domain-containing protein 160 n=1 Tax=Echinostoma caproni TaxID=27848 RepID=A0A183AY50_9TREM|nr:unnamed protein product [Echinostoma caproni]
MNTSASFEVIFDEKRPEANHFRPMVCVSPSPKVFAESDISMRLESADKRRMNVLTETKLKNEQHVQHVKAKREKGKEMLLNRSTEILGSLEEDLATKTLRRQQRLEEKISSAKLQVDQVMEVRTQSEAMLRESLSKQIAQDMANKENRRRSILENIKQQCQQTVSLFVDFKVLQLNIAACL